MKPLDRNISILEHIVGYCYGTVDPEVTWEILTEDIPKLKAYCGQIIADREHKKR